MSLAGMKGQEQAVAHAIRYAERCPDYYGEEDEQCDGLDGCGACLELSAEAVLAVLGRAQS